MAKVAFSKLNISKDYPIETLNFNNEVIEIKKYLPVSNKLELISEVLLNASENARFYNDVKVEVFFTIEIIKQYTNINFSKKQLEKVDELYDALTASGLYSKIIDIIGNNEIDNLYQKLQSVIKSIYAYENSVYGLLQGVIQDYENLNLDADTIKEKIANPENLALLKNVMDKLV